MSHHDPDTQLVRYLTDVHSIEEQALTQMRRAPDLVEGSFAEIFRRHLGETEAQERRVRARLEAHDASPSKLKDAAGQAGGFGMVLLARSQPDTPAKLAGFAYAVENREVAAYELLIRVARRANDQETVALAESVLGEEQAAARTVADQWSPSVAAA